jgi:hypothetical protein
VWEFCEQLSLFNLFSFFTLSCTVANNSPNALAALTGEVVCLIHSP